MDNQTEELVAFFSNRDALHSLFVRHPTMRSVIDDVMKLLNDAADLRTRFREEDRTYVRVSRLRDELQQKVGVSYEDEYRQQMQQVEGEMKKLRRILTENAKWDRDTIEDHFNRAILKEMHAFIKFAGSEEAAHRLLGTERTKTSPELNELLLDAVRKGNVSKIPEMIVKNVTRRLDRFNNQMKDHAARVRDLEEELHGHTIEYRNLENMVEDEQSRLAEVREEYSDANNAAIKSRQMRIDLDVKIKQKYEDIWTTLTTTLGMQRHDLLRFFSKYSHRRSSVNLPHIDRR